MILLDIGLIPHGKRILGSDPVVQGSIFSFSENGVAYHGYCVNVIRHGEGDIRLTGRVLKTRSGHRNPLHLLAAILADLSPEALDALGIDEARSRYDASTPNEQRNTMLERIKHERQSALHAVQRLAESTTPEARAALEEVLRVTQDALAATAAHARTME
jgi:hypothetical protein